MRTTIYDIARVAGVSISTVSKVLNNKGQISQATKQKVMRTVKALDYEPSAIATALTGKNTHSIGLLLPDINNPYFSEIVRGMEDEAFEHGYSVLICNTDNNEQKEKVYLWTLRQKKMDGLIIATGTTTSQTLDELRDDEIKIVLLARSIPNVNLATVMVDNFKGGFLAAEYLMKLGHKKIGVITESLRIGSSFARLEGFQAALTGKDIQHFVYCDQEFGINAGSTQAAKLFAEHDVTAIFTVNDLLAVGVLQACRKNGKSVPKDVSLIGFDNTFLSDIVYPPLTTIAQPIYDMGRKTVSLLIQAVESGTQPTETILIEPELVIRESTRPPKTDRVT